MITATPTGYELSLRECYDLLVYSMQIHDASRALMAAKAIMRHAEEHHVPGVWLMNAISVVNGFGKMGKPE